MKGFYKRFLLWFINHLQPFKWNKLKAFLFNRIPGCSIGKNSIIVGPLFLNGCTLNIGDNSHIGRNLSCEGNGKIFIGNNCDLGPNITMLTGSHIIGGSDRRAGEGQTLSINIEDGCWLGANSVFLGKKETLKVGPSSVVGCASNVVGHVKQNVLVAGNPAKIIKTLDIEE